jgi:hypothetical protein
VSQPDEINMTPTDEINEDALYEQAFNELQGDEKVIATWSRSFAEAEGEEEKAKALYISARVEAQKKELYAKLEDAKLEMEAEVARLGDGQKAEMHRMALSLIEKIPQSIKPCFAGVAE